MKEILSREELEYRIALLEREARWRKEAQHTLKEREDYLKILFEYAPDMYILCDPMGRLIDANRAAEKVTEYERQEVIGKDLFAAGIIDADQFEKAVNILSMVARKIPTEPEEFTVRKKSGQRLPVELRAYPVEMKGEPVVLIIARDVSRYRQDIEKWRGTVRWLEMLLDVDTDPVLAFEDETGRIEEANRSFLRLFGYERKALKKLTVEHLCQAESDRDGSRRSMMDILRTETIGNEPVAFSGFQSSAGEKISARILVRRFALDGKTWTVIRIR